ncbi:MAG: hypothetical protein U7127_17220 [Phormidium sp.]
MLKALREKHLRRLHQQNKNQHPPIRAIKQKILFNRALVHHRSRYCLEGTSPH